MLDYHNLSLRTRRPHRHRNSRKKQAKNDLCQDFLCQNLQVTNFDEKSNRVKIIRPPPIFNLEPPPNPLDFLDIQNSELYAIGLNQKLNCQTKNHNLTGPTVKKSPFALNNRLNDSTLEQSLLIRHHNFSRDGFIHETNIPQFIPQITTPASSILNNKENSIVNFFLLFGISMLTVLFVFIIFYVCFTRRKKISLRKKKRRSACQHQNDTSSEQVPSSSMSQSSYSSSDHPNNSLLHSIDQAQHLLAQEQAEFSHFIPNMTALGTLLNHQNNSQITEQQLPIQASYLSYDWLSLPQNKPVINYLGASNKLRQQMTLNEKFKKPDNNRKADLCACSTLSTRATTETSSNTSSSPSSTKSSNITHQTDQSTQPNELITNHYQKLFTNKSNSFRQNRNDQKTSNHLNYATNNMINSNLASPYLTNKVALLCNTNSNMPQLIKVMDIKELNDYVQLLNLDAKNRQIGIEHYENFYTNTESTRSPLMMPTPIQNNHESDEVYELIDDLTPFNNGSNVEVSIQNGSTLTHPSSSTLQQKKYPKTNPNYTLKT